MIICVSENSLQRFLSESGAAYSCTVGPLAQGTLDKRTRPEEAPVATTVFAARVVILVMKDADVGLKM